MRWLLLFLIAALPCLGAVSYEASSDQYQEATGISDLDEPITLACFFRRESNGIQTLMALNSSATSRWMLDVNSSSNLVARATASDGSSGFAFTPTGSGGSLLLQNGVWYHGAAVFASGSLRKVYLNGVARSTNTTGVTVSGVDRLIVGARRTSGTLGSFFDGEIARAVAFAAELSDDEIARLASGQSPYHIRPPHEIIDYLPLWNPSTAPVSYTGRTITVGNGPLGAVTDPPTVFGP